MMTRSASETMMSPSRYTLLIVDDVSVDREQYHRCLLADSSCRYTILEANSATMAIAICQHNQIDGILVNDALPDATGLEFVQMLQAKADGTDPPIVIVTSHLDPVVPTEVAVQRAVQCMKQGAKDYLITPLPEQLRLAMQSAIRAKGNEELLSLQQEDQLRIQQLNQDLANRVAELQALIDITPVGIAIASTPSCNPMQSNAYIRHLLGLPPNRNILKSAPLEEQPAYRVFQDGQEVPAEDLPMQVAARLGIDIRDTEIEIRLSDGTTRQLLSYASPLRSDQNEIRGAIGAFLDITERKQIEAELRNREEQLRLFIKHVPAGVAMFDREMRYIVASDRWLASYKLDSQDIEGRSHYEIFPDLPERWKAVHQRCLAGAIEACAEDRFLHADGSVDWVRWEIHPWRTNTDEIGGIILFSEVITDCKHTEEQLCEREATIQRQFAELESIYATAPVGLCFQDTDLRYLRINDRLAAINGIPASEHLGRTLHEVLPELADVIEPLHLQVIQTGEPILNVEIHGSTKVQPEIEQHWIASYYPLKDAEGLVLGVNVVVQDITELKQSQVEREQLLRQLEIERSFLEQILQQMPSGIAIAEVPSGKLLFHNDEAIRLLRHPMKASGTYNDYVQYGAFHASGQPFQSLEYPVARSVLWGEVVKAEEMLYRRGDGTETILSVNAAPIVDQIGRRIAAVSIFEDIAERKQIEIERIQLLAEAQVARAEAEAANRSKDEFVAIVAHELRSPLNAIWGWAKLLQTRHLDAKTTNKALETIVRNTEAQVQLVEDLLDISRIAHGTLQLTTASVNLIHVIETALETVRPTAEAKQLQLEAQLHDIGLIWGDFHRLQQVVLNLLTNAIKFTPEGGQVRVVLNQFNDQVQLQIIDTGKGIRPEFLPHIFERFRQDQQTATTKHGLGLGLAIVKHLVEMHEGTVTAESQGIGQGTTFTIMLPRSQQNERLQNEAIDFPLPDSAPLPLIDMRVLVVDDEPDTLNLTSLILEQNGAVVQTATSARSALEQLPQFQPNILLSDITMPEQDGYGLLRQVRSVQPEGQIPAIALTAHASQSGCEESLGAGFQKHLTKPVEPEQLVAAILSVVAQEKS